MWRFFYDNTNTYLLLNLNLIAFYCNDDVGFYFIYFYNLGLSKNISKYGKEATIASKKIFKTVYEGFKSFKNKILKKRKIFFKEFIKAADIEYSNFIKLNFFKFVTKTYFELLIILFLLFLS